MISYGIIFVVLLILELLYFKVADQYNIIDRPNERSSHSTIVLRGGGVIFTLSMIAWAGMMFLRQAQEPGIEEVGGLAGTSIVQYLPFLCGLLLIAGVSFWDDVHSLPDSVRLVVQFVAIGLMLWNLDILHWEMWYWVILSLIVSVGAINIINFMDGINGITGGYALAVLVPLLLLNGCPSASSGVALGFIEESYLVVAILGVLVFCLFNFWPKGKAKCFAGDVGSIGIAFIMLFAIGRLIEQTGDVTYLIFLLIYGVDGIFTIVHRIMLHENLGVAHRKHAFQLLANELKIGHVKVSLIYMALQLAVSLGFIYLCPNTVVSHWIYLVVTGVVLGLVYIMFMLKYYPLHEAYLKSLGKEVSHE